MIIIFFLVLILILIFLYLKCENEKFVSYSVDTLDSVTKHECYLIIDTILDDINAKYKKNLVRGEIERVEKTFINKNKLNYKINIFIYNLNKHTNQKILFDITYDSESIVVNSINSGISRNILDIERDAIPSRGSIVYKPKVNMDLVHKNNELKNNHSVVDFVETPNKQQNRTKWILDKEAKLFDNKNAVDRESNIKLQWDCFGIATNDNSRKTLRNIPNFVISNYTEKEDLYNSCFFDP
jgi:hypothetical protein